MMGSIDLNCDMGESYGNFRIGNDKEVFPFISSCNIACGFHGGDPLTVERTIIMAIENDVNIGAHPSYPDLMGFGRRKMHIPGPELKSYVKYQIAALKSLVESQKGKLNYVKPHGALYNSAVDNREEADVLSEAIFEIDPNLAFMGMAGTEMEKSAKIKGIRFISEAFADRRYTAQARLVSRNYDGAVINNPQMAANQVLEIVKHGRVMSVDGVEIRLKAMSICIHGDNPKVVDILTTICNLLEENQIAIKSPAI